MRHFRAGEGTVAALSFTPDGESLVYVEAKERDGPHRAVHWLDARTGERRRTLDLCEEGRVPWRLTSCEIGPPLASPDGQWVAALSWEDHFISLDLWDTKTRGWRSVAPETGYGTMEGVCFSA